MLIKRKLEYPMNEFPQPISKFPTIFRFGPNIIYKICINVNSWNPLYQHGLIFIPPRINHHMPCKVWDEITYPITNFNGCTVDVWKTISYFVPHIIKNVITYPYCLKSIHVSQRGPWICRDCILHMSPGWQVLNTTHFIQSFNYFHHFTVHKKSWRDPLWGATGDL